MTDIQGFLVTMTLDGADVTLWLNDLTLERSKAILNKATMDGTGYPTQLPSSKSGALNMNGQVDTAGAQVLEATWAKDVPVAFSLVVGDGATIAAGTYSGNLALSDFAIETSADDAWNFGLQSVTSGAVAYAAPA